MMYRSHILAAYFYEPILYHCKILVQIHRTHKRMRKKRLPMQFLYISTSFMDYHNGK